MVSAVGPAVGAASGPAVVPAVVLAAGPAVVLQQVQQWFQQ